MRCALPSLDVGLATTFLRVNSDRPSITSACGHGDSILIWHAPRSNQNLNEESRLLLRAQYLMRPNQRTLNAVTSHVRHS